MSDSFRKFAEKVFSENGKQVESVKVLSQPTNKLRKGFLDDDEEELQQNVQLPPMLMFNQDIDD
mgnify:CR=1 FL=1|jgi:hypothetical protein